MFSKHVRKKIIRAYLECKVTFSIILPMIDFVKFILIASRKYETNIILLVKCAR